MCIRDSYTIALHSGGGEGDSGDVVTVISRSVGERQVRVLGVPRGSYRDALSGETLVVSSDGPVGIPLRTLQSQVFVREGSPCLGGGPQ